MNIYCVNHSYKYELEKLSRLFFPLEKFEIKDGTPEGEFSGLLSKITKTPEETTFFAVLKVGEKESKKEKTLLSSSVENEERELALVCFEAFCEVCAFVPKWGILTGVRPSKLMMRHIESDGEAAAEEYFKNVLLVSPEKTRLAKEVALSEKKIVSLSKKDSASLYISIPFCPTRCSYCSFVSHSIASQSAKKLIPEYVEKLCEEIRLTAKKANECGLKILSVYWGGGTPTTLSPEELKTVLSEIQNSFDLSSCLEYTVEAGRPDTVTKEKLDVLKQFGVTRVSINPQTFNDGVLKAVKRNHTAKDTVEKLKLARSAGFDFINTDLIAGLPTDTEESFKNSVLEAIKLSPENITVHTLALKRSSGIVSEGKSAEAFGGDIGNMIKIAENELYKAGYTPYYMYRQSKSLGNLENVGWCKKGAECLYNVFMMEECHTILSVGAGAVTKLVANGGEYIERIFNYKYPFEYISRFRELCRRKERISEFVAEYK